MIFYQKPQFCEVYTVTFQKLFFIKPPFHMLYAWSNQRHMQSRGAPWEKIKAKAKPFRPLVKASDIINRGGKEEML